jgi:uncharacterized membrane protein
MTEYNIAGGTLATGTNERDPRLERLLSLTDGVYAIALTLLAFKLLNLPQGAEHLQGAALLEILLESWPRVFAFLTSFTAIAIFWQGDHQIFQHVTRFDGRLLWLVFLQLLCIIFLPFPTAVVSEHIGDLVAQEFYLGSLLLATLARVALWWYPSWGNRLVPPDLGPRLVRRFYLTILLAPVAFILLMILVALGVGQLINPLLLIYLMMLAYIAVAVFEWWQPREATSDAAVGEARPERPPTEERPEDDLTNG